VPQDPEQYLNPDHYAIVIGIDGYSQLPRLRAAGKDATRFTEWLTSRNGGGVPPQNVQVVLSPPGPVDSSNTFIARPIADDIDRAMADIGIQRALSERSRIGKRLYFYFSGHGVGPAFDQVGMLMANASMDRLKSNIGLHEYREFFRNTAMFDEVVFILDCCRDSRVGIKTSEPGFDGTGGWAAPDAVQDFVVFGGMYGEKAFQVWSSDINERRGLLTQAVLEALQKPDAADALGRFTASTLRDYVHERVPQLASEATMKQTPAFDLTQIRREIVFGTIPADQLPRLRIRIVAPPGLTGELVLMDRGIREMERRPATSVTEDQPSWIVELVRNRRYTVEHTESGPNAPANTLDLRNAQGDPYVYIFKP
jgi:uncharacterized caspase-like protein